MRVAIFFLAMLLPIQALAYEEYTIFIHRDMDSYKMANYLINHGFPCDGCQRQGGKVTIYVKGGDLNENGKHWLTELIDGYFNQLS